MTQNKRRDQLTDKISGAEMAPIDTNLSVMQKQVLGSSPLRNYKHELFARSRAMGLPVLECARRAGYDVMSQRNANRIARDRRVMARVNYLAGNTDEVIREKREAYERELSRICMTSGRMIPSGSMLQPRLPIQTGR